MSIGKTPLLSVEVSETLDGTEPEARRIAANEVRAQIGRFIVLGRLGEGGMGQVFSAYDPELDRKVAIKLMRSLSDDSSQAVARVRQEAQAMAKVSHPNVVQVYEVGESQGRIFIVMELVEGASLARWLEEQNAVGPEEVIRRLRIYLQAAAGLLAAHRCGLIHRDFKPDNVLLGRDGRVRVADFGLARVLAGLDAVANLDGTSLGDKRPETSEPRLTQVGSVLGTPGYMAPEQVRGAEADERSDQFGFCAALYEALYGQRPFPGHSFEEYAKNILEGRLCPPTSSHVPLVVQQAILHGLALDPTARFPSLQELITALEAGLAPESEPLITRKDRIHLSMGVLVSLIVVTVTNMAVAALTGSQNSLLRGVAVMGVFLCGGSVMVRWPPWPIRHPGRYRSMMGFLLLVLLTFFFGRLAGLLMRLPANDYFTLEVIALAGLLAVEALRVGWRHSILAILALAYAPFVRLLPDLRVLLYSLLLFGLGVASIVIHMRQPSAEPGPSGQPPES